MLSAELKVSLLGPPVGHRWRKLQLSQLLRKLCLQIRQIIAVRINDPEIILTKPDHISSPGQGILSIPTLLALVSGRLSVRDAIDPTVIHPQIQLRTSRDTQCPAGRIGQGPNPGLIIQQLPIAKRKSSGISRCTGKLALLLR